MPRTAPTFPFVAKEGALALSSDLDRDEQDLLAVVFTRPYERIMRPFLGTPDLLFSAQRSPNLIAKKLDVAIEEQCPTIERCNGTGLVRDDGTVVVQLNWTPKTEPQTERSLRIGVS